MKLKWARWGGLSALLVVVAIEISILVAPQAQAYPPPNDGSGIMPPDPCTEKFYDVSPTQYRCLNEGYFDDSIVVTGNGGAVMPAPWTDCEWIDPTDGTDYFYDSFVPCDTKTAAQFEQVMEGYLYGTLSVPWGVSGDDGGYSSVGAAFIIDTMLGYSPDRDVMQYKGKTGNVAGILYAKDNLARWKTLVSQYDAAGRIVWHDHQYLPDNHLDTSTAGGYYVGGPDVYAPLDVVIGRWFGHETIAIVFIQPDGSNGYMVDYPCGNPTGFPPLQAIGYNMQLDASVVNDNVPPGGTATLTTWLKNLPASTSKSDQGQMTIQKLAGPGTITAVAPQTLPDSNSRGGTGWDGTKWVWNTTKFQPGEQVYWRDINFTANVAGNYTLRVEYCPVNESGPNACDHKDLVFHFQSIRTPGVSFKNGDVHAGGGIDRGVGCNTPGNLVFNVNGGSTAEYVVAASSGTATNIAEPVKADQYAYVCRPDLVQAAIDGKAALGAGDYEDRNDISVDVGTLESKVYYFYGDSLSLHGQVNNKVTIVVPNASTNITIDGNITTNNLPRARTDYPTLGILAAGNIGINSGATQVDAYLFANQNIDTCLDAGVACHNLLAVNGFLMANTIDFRRTGQTGANPGSQIAESIKLTPQLYLNPPKFFDQQASSFFSTGLGESRPLY